MSSSISKRKERSGRDGNRRKRGECSNQTSKDAGKNNVGKKSSKGRYKKNNKKGTDQSRNSYNGYNPSLSNNRRRKKQGKGTDGHKEIQKQDSCVQARRKPRNKKRNRKRKASPASETVMSLQSSSSSVPLTVNSGGSQPNLSNPSTSPMDYEKFPWVNLNVPMDLSLVEFEIHDEGFDFDLQGRNNHKRWLANLEKEKNIKKKEHTGVRDCKK